MISKCMVQNSDLSYFILGIENGNLCKDVFYEALHCFGCPLFTDKTNVEDIEFSLKKFAQNQQLPADQKVSMCG